MPSWFVYVIKSAGSDFVYIGSTNRLLERLHEYNLGLVQSTTHYKPFDMIAYVAVQGERRARELEKYSKTGSGRAVLKKRILTDEVPQRGT